MLLQINRLEQTKSQSNISFETIIIQTLSKVFEDHIKFKIGQATQKDLKLLL